MKAHQLNEAEEIQANWDGRIRLFQIMSTTGAFIISSNTRINTYNHKGTTSKKLSKLAWKSTESLKKNAVPETQIF